MEQQINDENKSYTETFVEKKSRDVRSKILETYEKGILEDFQKITTFTENQLYWLNYLITSIEKRNAANVLYDLEYTSEDVKKLLELSDEESSLMKEHYDKYGMLDIGTIARTLTDTYRRGVILAIIKKMLNNDYNTDDVLNLIDSLPFEKE